MCENRQFRCGSFASRTLSDRASAAFAWITYGSETARRAASRSGTCTCTSARKACIRAAAVIVAPRGADRLDPWMTVLTERVRVASVAAAV
jgi:hypothetical protein